jgi:nucleotidyltransferase substrate binding protein (TIGR01987 family)
MMKHNPKLDLSSLVDALKSLKKALGRAKMAPEDDELRDACIQRFEYTYELSFKMLRRYLEMTSDNPREVDAYAFRDVIRIGAEKGLIAKVEAWFDYREARNQTSHAYDREEAEEVYAMIPAFADDAQDLLDHLQGKIASS